MGAKQRTGNDTNTSNRYFFGATSELKDLIALRQVASSIGYQKKNRANSQMAGLLSSSIKGKGMDFEEVRSYQPGDDVRNIDWKVTARTLNPHTKVFTEEKERPVFLIVDQSASMFFGSKITFKSVVAARIASIFAWSAHEQGDKVGGLIYSDVSHKTVRAKRGVKTVLSFLNHLNELNNGLASKREREPLVGKEARMVEVLRLARTTIKEQTSILLIGDFLNLDDTGLIEIRSLARRNQILAVHVFDPIEAQAPRPNLYSITDGFKRIRINTSDKEFAKNYSKHYENKLKKIHSIFSEINSPLISISTGESIETVLFNHKLANLK
tara:strand:+ start:363 stop:1340 length:978 start_codon:yes stop_codon:yes gene_type:complete